MLSHGWSPELHVRRCVHATQNAPAAPFPKANLLVPKPPIPLLVHFSSSKIKALEATGREDMLKVARAIMDWWVGGGVPNRCVSLTSVLSIHPLIHDVDSRLATVTVHPDVVSLWALTLIRQTATFETGE
jgi:hypothetical protein